jgi:hypothetical protein
VIIVDNKNNIEIKTLEEFQNEYDDIIRKSYLKTIKESYNFKHEDKRISIDDDTCFMLIASEYCNSLNLDIEDEKRSFLEEFAEFLELYLEVCDGTIEIE